MDVYIGNILVIKKKRKVEILLMADKIKYWLETVKE